MIYIQILSSILFLVAIVGLIVPFIPASPIAFLAILIYAIATKFTFISVSTIVIMFFVTILATALSYFYGIFSAKWFGATKYGLIGGVIGIITGIIFAPFGLVSLLILPPLGAIIGEIIGGKKYIQSGVSGAGFLIGMLFGIIIDSALIGWMIYVFIKVII